MKWFRHLTEAANDEFLADILERYGLEIYGFYWRIVEIIANQMKRGSDRCSVVYSYRRWLRDTYTTKRKFDLFLNILNEQRDPEDENTRKIFIETNGDKLTITMPSILKIMDNYSYQMKAQTPEKPKIEELSQEMKSKNKIINKKVKEVFGYYLTKIGKDYKLTEERKSVIKKRIKEGYTVEQMKKAVDNFMLDTWEDRDKYNDVVYIFGTIKKVNKLDYWLSAKPETSFSDEQKLALQI